jgi:hypothetical protein
VKNRTSPWQATSRSGAPWVMRSLVALLASAVLVLLTSLFQNNALALFPTHDYGGVHGFVRCVGYGLPFAFREDVSLIDTSSAHYHWWIFFLDVGVISVLFLAVAWLKAYSKMRA